MYKSSSFQAVAIPETMSGKTEKRTEVWMACLLAILDCISDFAQAALYRIPGRRQHLTLVFQNENIRFRKLQRTGFQL